MWCITVYTFVFSRLDGCDLTDDDIPDVVDCLDTVGRYDIKDL